MACRFLSARVRLGGPRQADRTGGQHGDVGRGRPNFEALWDLCNRYETTGMHVFTTRTRDLNL